jgi:hypothetical protein
MYNVGSVYHPNKVYVGKHFTIRVIVPTRTFASPHYSLLTITKNRNTKYCLFYYIMFVQDIIYCSTTEKIRKKGRDNEVKIETKYFSNIRS